MSNIKSVRPKVSVLMITYNHEDFIEQAIRSVLMQEADFNFELIIGEDCSTDRTREIILQLKREFPDRITLILHTENVGMNSNFFQVFNACGGEYIALLEGDDYWTHPKKLQIQVDYLDEHSTCRICTHDANVVSADQRFIKLQSYHNIDGLENYFKSQEVIPTCSIVFRSTFQQLPLWFLKFKAASDWQLHLWLLMQGGTICHLDGEPMASYRVHVGGIASFMQFDMPALSQEDKFKRIISRSQQIISDQETIYQHLPSQVKPYMQSRIYMAYVALARTSYEKDRNLFWETYRNLCSMSSTGVYIPNSPIYLSLVSRLIGYPRAEWIASLYRKLIPVSWRKQLQLLLG